MKDFLGREAFNWDCWERCLNDDCILYGCAMNRRRRSKSPEPPRLDWRDPNMPVLGKSGREIDHRKMVIKANMALQDAQEPTWRNDPTYNLRKDKS